ncbi:hypothetical protein S40288_11309 [Stachybotrys chartarum IBT 40288]|nr:hypothetical protein S40288_11309 [Stachybotrys chartarum IBT 40288]
MSNHHKHGETGVTDEVAIESHDLIHGAEIEEQRLHPKDSQTRDPTLPASAGVDEEANAKTGGGGKAGGMVGKVKETLNLK